MEIVPKRKWQYPISIEREYARLLTAYVDKELEIVEEFLPDMVDSVYQNRLNTDRLDNEEDFEAEEHSTVEENTESEQSNTAEELLALLWLSLLIDRIQRKVKEKLTPLAAIRKTFQQVNKFVSTQMTETVESLFGSKPRQFNNTRQFEMIQTIWTSQNLELVKSIDTQIMEKLRFMMSQRIIHAAEKPELKEQLIQEIQDLAKVTRNRAALIAVDQVGKLNSQLTQYRQVNAGIKEYIWNTRKDNRVRPAHSSREGKKYKWSEPPSDGHPGWPIRCRCTALPVVDTDGFGVQPKSGSFVYAPDVGTTTSSSETSKGKFILTNLVNTGTTDTMKDLFTLGQRSKIYVEDETFIKPFAFEANSRKVFINPKHTDFYKYNLPEAITHETIHWLDNLYRWNVKYSKSINDIIDAAGKYVLSKENIDTYRTLLKDDFFFNMSVSDIFSNITLNKIRGALGHDTDGYWLKDGNGGKYRRYDLIAELLTIYTVGDKKAEKLIKGIPPLADLYEGLVDKYDKVLGRRKKTNT